MMFYFLCWTQLVDPDDVQWRHNILTRQLKPNLSYDSPTSTSKFINIYLLYVYLHHQESFDDSDFFNSSLDWNYCGRTDKTQVLKDIN